MFVNRNLVSGATERTHRVIMSYESAAGVRKVFLEAAVAGSHTDYWEQAWQEVQLTELLNILTPDSGPVWQLLADQVPRQGRVLEAGCGSGIVLAYLRRLGCAALGVDQATMALQSARRQIPDLPLVAGDIRRSPFSDSTFDYVISLGVVEHLEEGPLLALEEHYRILQFGGVLLIGVPRLSPLKRWNDFRYLVMGRRENYMARGRIVTRVPAPEAISVAWMFHQYEFPRHVFRSSLEEAGFEVKWIRPLLVSAGVGESRLIQKLAARRQKKQSSDQVAPARAVDSGPIYSVARSSAPKSGLRDFIRQAALRERGRSPIGRVITRVSQELFGHVDIACAVKAGSYGKVRSRDAR